MNPVVLTLFGDEYMQPEKPKAKPENTRRKKTAIGKKISKKSLPSNTDILAGWTPEKQYYSIGEVAALYKVNNSLIRFWTKEFDLKVRTTKKGDRLYAPANIEEIKKIYLLTRQSGFTLAGAKQELKEQRRKKAGAEKLRMSLIGLKKQLERMRRDLD